MKKISTSTNTQSAVKDSDLIVEAIVENVEVKQKLFAELEKNAKK